MKFADGRTLIFGMKPNPANWTPTTEEKIPAVPLAGKSVQQHAITTSEQTKKK